ncbi:hypothetical protein BC936DRAFT_144873, partial [Jimgerdemannia flammicorona]
MYRGDYPGFPGLDLHLFFGAYPSPVPLHPIRTSDLGRDQKPILASWPHHRASTTGTVSSLSKSPNQPGVIDICSWVIDEPRMGGDHVCIRINTPRGKWYSVGQYRPQKMGFHEQFVFSMKIKPIKFTCPDVSEFWRGPHRLRLRNHQFRKMKKQVEQYQPNREYTYQLFHGNCTRYSRSIAEMASTSLPPSSSSSFSSATSRSTTSRGGFSTQSSPPPFLVKSWTVCFNTFGLLWESGIVDKEVKEAPSTATCNPTSRTCTIDGPRKVHHPTIPTPSATSC